MGIFSEIDLEATQSDSSFSSDTLHPVSTTPCAAPRPSVSAIMQDAFEDGGPAERAKAESDPQDIADPETKKTADEKETGKPNPGDAAEAERERAEAERRRAYEEVEAKRKAAFEAKQAAKKAAEQEQLARLSAMSDEEVMMASMRRVAEDTEKLTRRNMKECVSELIQTKCLDDPAFARRAMHPRKSMIHCIWYINRKAREYLQKEMKNNAEESDINGIYGGDVPDDLCYQWAEDYFNDPDAEEDREKEETFVPKPYISSTSGSKTRSSKRAGPSGKEKPKKAENKPKQEMEPENPDQMSLLGDFGMIKESA